MIVIRAKAYGMCFGVRDAIAEARRAASSGPVTVLGQLVHNPTVLEDLRQRGVEVRESTSDLTLSPERSYLITAHGASDRQRQEWNRSGAEVGDTTCPLVRRAHDRLREFVMRGLHPVVIGKVGHVEVRGLIGDYPAASVVESESDVERLPLGTGLGIVSQTTQPIERVRELVKAIRLMRSGQQVEFADTVCQPTKDRQTALRELCAQVEVVVVVGGRESNNTRQLVLSAQGQGVRAYSVESPQELDVRWLDGVMRVGLTAGTSTPEPVIDAVEEALRRLAAEITPPDWTRRRAA